MRERWEQGALEEQCATSKVCTTVAEYMKRQKAGEIDLELQAGIGKERRKDYTFGVSVVARFRPLPSKAKREASAEEEAVTESVSLPLHQRLALIRTRSGCTEAEAKSELFGACSDPFSDAFLSETDQENTILDESNPRKKQSAKRGPPKSVVATAETQQGIVSLDSSKVTMCAAGVGLRDFTCFEAVFGKEASQGIVYEAAAREQVSQFLNGVNSTVLCYGQTGSGKTYTLLGNSFQPHLTLLSPHFHPISGPNAEAASSLTISPGSGVLPRVCHEATRPPHALSPACRSL